MRYDEKRALASNWYVYHLLQVNNIARYDRVRALKAT